ncbi:hypothetical protein [Agrobacterium sp. OT33]|uniref:hypothetical protein n=1 Tax=Agrobacterium sp. OT33 TaxID=2815338 RepID=UPI001A8E2354|nr:hypothetical protein [Agrobacterium sp. OT33]MBO0125218.1 hypothetical protein [Agrobacterium sp. OT33]
MAYVPDNLSLSDTQISGYQPRRWRYTTAADSDATIVGAGYFSDGVTKGMKVGDLVDVVATTGPKYKLYQVASVSGAAATVTAPTAIT